MMIFRNAQSKKPKDIEEVENLWYDGNTSRKYEHYDDSRYHALNFHSVFSKEQ